MVMLVAMYLMAPIAGARAAVQAGIYKLPAGLDSTVLSARATELWAKVWAPATAGPFPLVVLLHGNHSTCGHFDVNLGARIDDNSQYTTTGTCPAGYVVAPSHLGYAYLAQALANAGYVVVSINANRGINAGAGISGDSGLNLARGRLVLRHLQELQKWNSGSVATPPSVGFSLAGLIDFNHVGLMGHSRGGEGMRAAMAQFQDAGSPWPARIGTPVHFDGIFEIGPVDGQTSRILNAPGVPWTVLLPGCDGDVSDLEGVKPFDRMLKPGTEAQQMPKATFEVFGANHNFFNSQWQFSETPGCDGQTPLFPDHPGSASQRLTASVAFQKFMVANIGTVKHPNLLSMFDPSYPVPATLNALTEYSRGFAAAPNPAQNLVVDDFENNTGTSTGGFANQSSGLSQYSHGAASFSHDFAQRAASVNWNAGGGFLQLNAAAAGVDVAAFKALEFRVALRCFGSLCSTPPSPTGDVDFSISLVNGNGSQSASVPLKSFAVVRRPSGAVFAVNSVMRTVRIPLSAFAGADPTKFHGVRLTFDKTAQSSIYLANVRLDKWIAGPGGPVSPQGEGSAPPPAKPVVADFNQITAVRVAPSGAAGEFEIELASNRAFPASDALPELLVSGRKFRLSRFGDARQRTMIFTLSAGEFASIANGSIAEVRIGGARPWAFGPLRKP